MPKLVILRGKPTAGKSTAFQALRIDKRLRDWIFIDHAAIKEMFENLPDEDRRKIGKEVLFYSLKKAMPLKKNILIEEMSRETVKKYLEKDLAKYKYTFIVFQFEVSLETAYNRDVRRAKDKWHVLMGKDWIDETHQRHAEQFDKKAILIDTDKLNKEEVIAKIISHIK